MIRRGTLLALGGACVIAVGIVFAILALGSDSKSEREAGQCPQGQRIVRAEDEPNGEKKGEPREYESHFVGKCAPVSHPESDKDLARFTEFASTRHGSDTPRKFARAVRQRQRMERSPVR